MGVSIGLVHPGFLFLFCTSVSCLPSGGGGGVPTEGALWEGRTTC